ncbi:hypothetical protein [Tsukamurella tyrosinosolvens]|uniref:hypothetical protein n=1 Tax=Tsukamurella tyrosinosolvens TaxID=57704 RepID=UPI002DD43AD2|nr:hypothetical protein [Tsukamurella tyrosinosolvens]MEC4616195.1 hypothetical protein [Tsukamurella tyrosinosolvens]
MPEGGATQTERSVAMAHTNVKNTGVYKPGQAGGVFRFPLGTILPTDASSPLPVIPGWDPRVSGCSEDGFVTSTKRDIERKKDWNGDKVRAIQTGKDDTAKCTFIEPKSPAMKELVFGASNVTVTAATASHGTQIASVSNSLTLEHYAYVVETWDGNDKNRMCIPDAQATEIGDDQKAGSKDWSVREITFDLYPDLAGNTYYEYDELDDKLVVTNFTVTVTGSPTGGTFTLTVGGQTTAAIAYNATATAVKAALEALSNVDSATVTGTGPYTVAVTAAGAAAVTGDGAALTPSGTVVIS